MKNSEYVLGHSDFELRRLARQAELLEPSTREYFHAAGMAPGMRVLDVGSGTGEVAFLAAEFVDPSGEVLGTDIAPVAIALHAMPLKCVGKLMSHFARAIQPKWYSIVRSISSSVAVCFTIKPIQLLCFAGLPNTCGLVARCFSLNRIGASCVRSRQRRPMIVAAAGSLTYSIGWALVLPIRVRECQAFLAAGLPAPMMRLRMIIGDAVSASEWLRAVADIAIVMLPAMEQHGIATSTDIDCDTIAERLVHEVASSGSIVIGRAEVGTWSRV